MEEEKEILFKYSIILLFLAFFISCEPIKNDPLPKNIVTSESMETLQLPSSENKTMEKDLEKVVWINPGKVFISNLFPGAQAEWNLRIHNEKSVANDFFIYYKVPDYTDTGYEKLPEKFRQWIVMNDKVTIPPKSVGEVLITVKMDKNDYAYMKKYEAWIAVMDASQEGMIRTELCSRWFISTQ
jgi:hypothetical protein